MIIKKFFNKGVKFLKNKKGFSLIEIMVGLGLLIIIGGIASTQYRNFTEQAKKGVVNASLRAIETAVGLCILDGTTAVTNCLNRTVNNSIIEKKGFRIGVWNNTTLSNVCFYVVESDSNANHYTVPSNIPLGKMFGRVGFKRATGEKPTISLYRDARIATNANRASGCVAGDHP